MSDIVSIYKAENVYEAKILCQALGEAGITANVDGGNLTGFAGDASVGALGHVKIVVAAEDEAQARTELEQILKLHSSKADSDSTDAE